MTTSILNDCLLLKDKTLTEIEDYLKTINLTIFNAIISKYNEMESKQIILFILCAYSEDSPLLILRQDSKEEKEGICEYLRIPEYLRPNLYSLLDEEIRKATTGYLTQFAGPLFRSLMFAKIQYDDFELGVTNRSYTIKTTKKEGEAETTTELFDIKEHGKALAEMSRLAKNIDALEKQIKLQVKQFAGIEDLKSFSRDAKDSGKIKGLRTGNVENTIT